jgi:lysylphosphatidylglycerol synthetase-like protein (DUF2156 family)
MATEGGRQDGQIRRNAAALIAMAGSLNVVSALTPPLWSRFHELLSLFPLAVSESAAAFVTAAGIGLVFLARGIRRGQRSAWALAIVLLLGSTLLHLLKGIDVEEAVVALGVAGYLLGRRASFTVPADEASARWGAAALGLAGAGALLVVAVRPANAVTLGAVTVTATMAGLAAAWLLFRPLRPAQRAADRAQRARAVDIVRRHGGDTLSYFALRGDKRYFIWGDTVVAYAVIGGVCLVSPDPIGPADQRAPAWSAYRDYASAHGWDVAVLGACEEWLPLYRSTGMRAVYVGDEGIVDVDAFHLDGGHMKGLRQAVNRIDRYGYRVQFYDPAGIGETLRTQLHRVMTQSRRGKAERGFSMTLGRAFDPADEGLLLAVAFDRADQAVAFCQFVPASDVNGYSLDLMRRDKGDHPNGLVDFVVVRTIQHLREAGCTGLGLNFATLRGVMAGERGGGMWKRVQRWLLYRLSDDLQIESLWRFNAKYDPAWMPRYAVFADPEQVLSTAVAIARAESFSELPLRGRFFTPKPAPPQPAAA